MASELPEIPLLPKYRHLKAEYDAVVQCNRCGFCETVCPTYMASGKETLSPRGRNQAFRQILEGKLKDPASASDIFSTCLTCHACTNTCFAEVPVARLMATARDLAVPSVPRSVLVHRVIRTLFARRKLVTLLVWPAFLAKRLKLSGLLKRLGLLEPWPELEAGEELLETVPLIYGGGVRGFGALRRRSSPKLCGGGGGGTAVPKVPRPFDGRVAYFSGCGTHWVYPGSSRAVVDLLRAASRELILPDHPCCGLTAASAGDPEGARELARAALRRFEDLGADRIVVDDDSCAGFMLDYEKLRLGDRSVPQFVSKVRDLSQFLEETGALAGLEAKSGASRPVRVTYHDPCQMGNGRKAVESPRAVLRSLPGVEFTEMEEANWCCGGAGTFCLKHPALADEVVERKVANIRKTGAEVVVTQASSCMMHLAYGLRKDGGRDSAGPPVRVTHLAEFILERLQGPL